jgi:NTE family protein
MNSSFDIVNIDTICMSGGSVKGLSFLGVLSSLQSKSFIDISKIKNWVGTSAGSVLCFFFSIGYTVDEIIDFILNFNIRKVQPEPDITRLLEHCGIDDGNTLKLIFTEFLKQKCNVDDITFEQHYKLTNKKLVIIGTNFTRGSEAVFSYETTPNMSIILALRISSSVPVVFSPVLYNEEYYIDGGLVNNFPIKHCNPTTTLGIYIKNSSNNQLPNIVNFIQDCMCILSDVLSTKDWTLKYPYIIEINNIDNKGFTTFDVDDDRKIQMIELGKKNAEKFIENFTNIQYNFGDQSTQTD